MKNPILKKNIGLLTAAILFAVILIILLLAFFGIPKTGASAVDASEMEHSSLNQNTLRILTTEDMKSLLDGKKHIEPDVFGAALYYNGASLISNGKKSTFYMTVPEKFMTGMHWYGLLHTKDGITFAAYESRIPEDLSDIMAKGEAVKLYLLTEEAYTSVELVFTMLPVISMDTQGNRINRNDKECFLQTFDMTDGGMTITSTANHIYLSYRGDTSINLDKKGFRIKIRTQDYANGKKVALFGMRQDDDWILNPIYSDYTKFHDAVAWELWRDLDSYFPGVDTTALKHRYVEVLLDGEYYGIYLMLERLDQQTLALTEEDVLFKSKELAVPSSTVIYKTAAGKPNQSGIWLKYPDYTLEIDGLWHKMAQYVNLAFESNNSKLKSSYAEALNLQNIMDYWLFLQLIMGEDNVWKNAYYAEKDGLIYILPWDMDISMGYRWSMEKKNYLYPSKNLTNQIIDYRCGQHLLRAIPEAVSYTKERWQQLLDDNIFTVDNIMKHAEHFWSLIHNSGAITRELERWPNGNYAADSLEYLEEVMTERIAYLSDYIKNLD